MIIINLIYPIFTALVETKVSQIEHIHTYIHIYIYIYTYIFIHIYKENLAKLHKRTINYILKKKKIIAVGKD